MRRIVRILAVLGLAALVVAVIRRLLADQGETAPAAPPWEPLVEPRPPTDSTTTTVNRDADSGGGDTDTGSGGGAAWVDPGDDGSCPSAHPVKAKLSSKIFHLPGGGSYDRTGADRCYRDAAAAEADGLRQAKR